jgi:hypothetical protein
MESVPLADALKNLARRADLHLALDPSLPMPSSGPGSQSVSEYDVSVRWINETPRQALAALLDNYDLVLVQDSATVSARIVAKAQTASVKSPKER